MKELVLIILYTLGDFCISFIVFVHVLEHIYYFLNKLEDSVNLR